MRTAQSRCTSRRSSMGEDGNIGFPCCQRNDLPRCWSVMTMYPCLTPQDSSISVAVLQLLYKAITGGIEGCTSWDSCLEHPVMASMRHSLTLLGETARSRRGRWRHTHWPIHARYGNAFSPRQFRERSQMCVISMHSSVNGLQTQRCL